MPSDTFLERLRKKALLPEPKTKVAERTRRAPERPQKLEEDPEGLPGLEEREAAYIEALSPRERTTWESLTEIFPGEILDVRLAPKE